MSRRRIVAWLSLGVFLAALPAAADAQDRVAQITTAKGSVDITRADDGTVDKARQVGPRVRNGSVYARDVVSTKTEANATIVFSDGSNIRLDEDTSLAIREHKIAAIEGGLDKPMGRTVKVLAGKIWADVVPSGTIATQFETPTGVAAVKGTSLVLEVRSGGEQ